MTNIDTRCENVFLCAPGCETSKTLQHHQNPRPGKFPRNSSKLGLDAARILYDFESILNGVGLFLNNFQSNPGAPRNSSKLIFEFVYNVVFCCVLCCFFFKKNNGFVVFMRFLRVMRVFRFGIFLSVDVTTVLRLMFLSQTWAKCAPAVC
jgi:hypothetical protein